MQQQQPRTHSVDVRIADDDALRMEQVVEVVRKYSLPVFAEAPADATFDVSVLSGGITNQLYRVSWQAGGDSAAAPSVVVRVFGKETDRIISRESELYYQSLFLPTYCRGENFLIYEFLTGYKDIDFLDMPTLRVNIALEIAAFHFRATASAVRCLVPAGGSGTTTISRFDGEDLACFSNIRNWSATAFAQEAVSKLTEAQQERIAASGLNGASLLKESELLLDALEKLRPELTLGVCHNDLLCANIMRKVSTDAAAQPSLVLIDFEYSKKNFLLFDLANHFNEYVGLECDYDRLFPSDETILDSVVAYRAAMRAAFEQCEPASHPFKRSEFDAPTPEAERAAALRWVQLIKMLTLASNLMWTAWAMLQAAHSAIDFDFAWYATQRWGRYIATKETFWVAPAAAY